MKKKKEPTLAELERGVGLLNSVKIVVNVLFALLIFQAFLILPRPGDPLLEYNTLEEIFSEHIMSLLVIVVGLILIVVYWIQFNLLFGNIKRSTPLHATLALTQVIFLMIYLYFLRFDMEYDGLTLALQMESIFLALAGFIGAFNWRYAKSIASVITFPFAVMGPGIWTLAFLSIIPVTYILKFVRKKKENA